MAAYAVFGKNHPFQPIGQSLTVETLKFAQQLYFEGSEPEGKIIPMQSMQLSASGYHARRLFRAVRGQAGAPNCI